MLTNFEVALYSLSLIIVPVALYSLLTGSKAPENTWASKYYAAEKYLGVVGNVFLLMIGGNGLMKLATHFGFISASTRSGIAPITASIFTVVLVAYLVLWFRALRKVRS